MLPWSKHIHGCRRGPEEQAKEDRGDDRFLHFPAARQTICTIEEAAKVPGLKVPFRQHESKLSDRKGLASQPSLPPLYSPTPSHTTFSGLPRHLHAPLAELPRETAVLPRSGSYTGNVAAPWDKVLVAEMAPCGAGEQE